MTMNLYSAARDAIRDAIYREFAAPQRDPQPGSLQSKLETIDRERAERAAAELGFVAPGYVAPEDIPAPSPPESLPTTVVRPEPYQPAVTDPLLLVAREAARVYDKTAAEWTYDGCYLAIIAAVLPAYDAIRESGIEQR